MFLHTCPNNRHWRVTPGSKASKTVTQSSAEAKNRKHPNTHLHRKLLPRARTRDNGLGTILLVRTHFQSGQAREPQLNPRTTVVSTRVAILSSLRGTGRRYKRMVEFMYGRGVNQAPWHVVERWKCVHLEYMVRYPNETPEWIVWEHC